MEKFVAENSIVRKIWGSADTILFIFAGASAEFALNKAVDWLYFTGRLPADPLGRLFSTVAYAQQIVFADNAEQFALHGFQTAVFPNAAITSARRMQQIDVQCIVERMQLAVDAIAAFQ